METKAKPTETSASFLDTLGDELRGKEGVDVDLVNILRTQILTAAPSLNAVAESKEAILTLARERAERAGREPSDG
jgi:hypothetical protein